MKSKVKTIDHSPRISIGLPVYNGELFLKEAVNSILAQSFTDFELIISDNASTDTTEHICRAYAARDRRVRYYRNDKNLGAAKNFNLVFELSSGKYFKWAAADDVLDPEFLEKCVKPLDDDSSVVLTFPRIKIMDDFQKKMRFHAGLHYDLIDLESDRVSERFFQLFLRLFGSNSPIFGLIRTAVLKETNLIGPFIHSDSCLLVDLILKGKFAQVPEYLLLLRAHPDAYSTPMKKSIRGGRPPGITEAKWLDPKSKSRVVFPRLRRLREHSFSVVRSEVEIKEKLAMMITLCRVAKWSLAVICRELVIAARQFFHRKRPV